MEELILNIVKVFLFIFAAIGAVYHILVLRSPEVSKKVEQKLGAEIGVRKKFFPWLEDNRMKLHDMLVKSKAYNIFALIALVVLLILLLQI
jgi:hypothetical protein